MPRRRLALLLVLMLLGSASEGVGLMLLVPLLELQAGASSQSPLVQHLLHALERLGIPLTLPGLLLCFVLMVGLRSGLQYAQERLGSALRLRHVDALRERCFGELLNVEWRWLAASRRSDFANLLLTDIGRLGVGLQYGLSLLTALVTGAVYAAVALALSWKMTLLALLTGAVVFAVLGGQRRRALNLGRGLSAANRAMHARVQEALAGIKLTRVLGAETRHRAAFSATLAQQRAQSHGFTQGTAKARALFQFGAAALLALFVWTGVALWDLPVAELAVLVLLFARLVPLFVAGQQQLHHWLHALPALEDIERWSGEWRAHAEPRPGPVEAASSPAGEGFETVREAICLRDVSFRHTGQARPALNQLTLRLPARTTTALIGASGAGKSTLADLLMGLLSPDSGVMSVDGMPLEGARRLAWRRHVAYVPQEVFLFNDSIRNNLLWARPQATEIELRQALQRAAAEFVFELPEGLDTHIGDNGIRLSGGERQRLTLARALLGRPALLILDEATSALDVENEARIRTAVEKLHGDLTVLLIGHRLQTLEHADQVLLLDAGRLAAEGDWQSVRDRVAALAG